LGIKEIITIFSPFWGAEAGAEGYILEVAYGLAQGANANPAATAEWDRLAVMTGPFLITTSSTPTRPIIIEFMPSTVPA